eukprot:4643419-Ditylum_brightwellii.AAC.1
MQDRTIRAIALGPSMNMQGGYKFLNLESGEIINRRKFTELPMPESVIKKVEAFATADGEDRKIIFTNRAGAEISKIRESDEYEDWPDKANLTGVALQDEQDQQETVNSYVAENNNKDFDQKKRKTKMKLKLDHHQKRKMKMKAK